MAGKNQHVVRREDGWAVLGAGNSRGTARYGTQAEIRVLRPQMRVVSLREVLVGLGGRVRAADQAGDVEGIGEPAERDAVAAPVLDRLHARLEVETERLCIVARLGHRF